MPALAELDEKLVGLRELRDGGGGGLLLVEVPSAARDAWMAHVERRLRAMYREVFVARAGVASPVWSRLVTQLGGALDADARRLARTVTTAARPAQMARSSRRWGPRAGIAR